MSFSTMGISDGAGTGRVLGCLPYACLLIAAFLQRNSHAMVQDVNEIEVTKKLQGCEDCFSLFQHSSTSQGAYNQERYPNEHLALRRRTEGAAGQRQAQRHMKNRGVEQSPAYHRGLPDVSRWLKAMENFEMEHLGLMIESLKREFSATTAGFLNSTAELKKIGSITKNSLPSAVSLATNKVSTFRKVGSSTIQEVRMHWMETSEFLQAFVYEVYGDLGESLNGSSGNMLRSSIDAADKISDSLLSVGHGVSGLATFDRNAASRPSLMAMGTLSDSTTASRSHLDAQMDSGRRDAGMTRLEKQLFDLEASLFAVFLTDAFFMTQAFEQGVLLLMNDIRGSWLKRPSDISTALNDIQQALHSGCVDIYQGFSEIYLGFKIATDQLTLLFSQNTGSSQSVSV